MPIPKIKPNETMNDYMKRSMGNKTMMEDYPDMKQRYAVLKTVFDKKSENNDFDPTIMQKVMDLYNIPLDDASNPQDSQPDDNTDNLQALLQVIQALMDKLNSDDDDTDMSDMPIDGDDDCDYYGIVEDDACKNKEINSIMEFNSQYQIGQLDPVTGRSNVTYIVHEIYPDDSQFNKNGISWQEQYTRDNQQSAIMMPLTVSFIDEDNEIPSNHGTPVVDEEGNIQYRNSVTVGAVSSTEIADIIQNGEKKKVLLANGVLYTQRYPNMVAFLKEQQQDTPISTSVEICGKSPNKAIKYVNDFTGQGRIPMVYDYTGSAILFNVQPADDSALMLEINSLKQEAKKEEKNMDENKINELNQVISEKDTEINTLRESNEKLTSESNALAEEKTKLEGELQTKETEINELKGKIAEYEVKELVNEFNESLKQYPEDLHSVAKEKIGEFNSAPSKEIYNEVFAMMDAEIKKRYLNAKSKTEKKIENNSVELYGDIETEINSKESTEEVDLY